MSDAKTYIHQIITVLDSIAEELSGQPSATDTDWTHSIKTSLLTLWQKSPLKQVATSGVEGADYSEWLYDLTWLKMKIKPDKYEWLTERIELVMESEWLRDTCIDEDFDKLVQARATLRLMIFQGDHREHIDEINKRLSNRVAAFSPKSPSDIYLLAAYNNSLQSFQYFEMDGQGIVKARP